MASTKRRKKVHRAAASPSAAEIGALKRQLEDVAPPGQQVVVVRNQGASLSGALTQLVAPFMEMATNVGRCERLMQIGALAWNVALLPEVERQELVAEAAAAWLEAGPAGSEQFVLEIAVFLRLLIDRKETLYPNDKRFIAGVHVTTTESRYHITVAAMPER